MPDPLASLQPALVALAVRHLRSMAEAGIRARIVQGLRTEEQQAALWAKGRTLPGKRVTNAQHAKDTPHGPGKDGLGRAYDIAIYDGLVLSWADNVLPLYDRAGVLGKLIGLEWGGDWMTLQDRPHFQMPSWRSL